MWVKVQDGTGWESGDPPAPCWEGRMYGEGAITCTCPCPTWPGSCDSASETSMTITQKIDFLEALESVNYHVQVQVTTLDDITFASPIIDTSSETDQNNWEWKRTGSCSDNTTSPIPPGGFQVFWSCANFGENEVATVYFDAVLCTGTYLVRFRQ